MSTASSHTSSNSSLPDDPEFQDLVRIIKESHKNSTDDALQQDALQRSMTYIHNHAEEKHLFCDKLMFHPAIHALILFSFPENDALTWYKEKIAHSLNTCSKCIMLFHRGRAKLKLTFAIERGIDASSVQEFTSIILRWEAQRLLDRLKPEWDQYIFDRQVNTTKDVPRGVLFGFAEFLYAPGILRQNAEVKALFNDIFNFLQSINHKFIATAPAITPGMIYLLFDGDSEQREWAMKHVENLYNPNTSIRYTSAPSDILEEFSVHFLNIQSPKFLNDDTCETFYRNVYPIIRLYDEKVIVEKFNMPQDIDSVKQVLNYEVVPLLRLLQNHIMSFYIEPLPQILKFFTLILQIFGEKFWNHTSTYTFHNFIETITGSQNFVASFEHLSTSPINVDEESTPQDLMGWIDPFIKTLVSSKKQQALNRLSLDLISHMENMNKISLDNKALIFVKACELISDALTIDKRLYSAGFGTDLLLRSDSRVVIDQKLIRFIDYATCRAIFFPPNDKLKNAEVSRKATEVLCKALKFDLLSFAQNSFDIHNGEKPSTLTFSPALFKALLNQNLAVQLELAFQLICSMDTVSGIIPLKGPHEKEVKQILEFLQQFFTRFSDIDVKNTKMILSNPKSLNGYWSCVFSSDSNLYQSAVDILYETFDASGRLEGIHDLLENNLDACIKAINSNLTNLIFIKFYEPCPRAVRVLKDVVEALNDKVTGLFNDSSKFSDSTKDSLIHFWNRCWNFLDLIYVETLHWANKYSENELVEFTRDTLDLSQALLDCFKTIKDIASNKDGKQTIVEVTNTFPHMLVWLRLSDPGLLASCVRLITSTADLAMELELELDSTVIVLLAKYGSRAKKFNNKLTNQQSTEIIEKAKQFDKKLVEITIEESESYRRQKEASEESQISNVSSRDSTPAVTARPTDTSANRARGQLKITNFGSLSKVAPSAPAKPQLPMSALEKARREMKSGPPRVIHEARPSGFNSRAKPIRTPKADDSSDDESETEDAHSLFNLPPSKKQPGITILGDKKASNRPKMSSKKERELEEQNSRKRLNVDLKPLYSSILKWSYQNESDYPSGSNENYPIVPDRFASANDYIKSYEPLLFLECWQAILSSKKRESEVPIPVNIASKSVVGEFYEVFLNLTRNEISEKGLSDSDLVVIALHDTSSIKDVRASDVANSKITCLAKINDIKYVKGDSADVSLRIHRNVPQVVNNMLNPHSPIIMMKVMQMTTIEREYSSLHGLAYYNLSRQILQATPDTSAIATDDEIEEVQKNYKVNRSQANAIASSIKAQGFFLVQGPPGTGKTKTILGIISHMLSNYRANSNVIQTPSVIPGKTLADFKNKKVLICAPSNAAVDELVLRLKDGIPNAKGEIYNPQLVRLGRSDAINTAVKDMTLEELVDAKLGKNTATKSDTIPALLKELSEVKHELEKKRAILAAGNNKNEEKVRGEIRDNKLKQNKIKKQLDEEREAQTSSNRTREVNRRNIQAQILNEAEIICSTLSGAAHDMVANIGIKFDSVVIDEACQCTELSAIIPLRYGCQRCIMVGDPNQLPPTVLSSVAAESKYDQSLFVRMTSHSKPLLLDVQYRMHSDISKFPSKKFYDGHLQDGPSMDVLTKREWHKNVSFPPYRFYDIAEGKESQNSKTFSYVNKMEIKIAIELIDTLYTKFGRIDYRNKIGVITPYKEQNRAIQQAFIRHFGNQIRGDITFNTIDGFQGQEKEIIIMSCVRADSNKSGVGFLKDFRRMNVALTRSKCSLWILGHNNSLVKNDLWSDLITDAKDRNMFETVYYGFTSNSNRSIKPSTVADNLEENPQSFGPQKVQHETDHKLTTEALKRGNSRNDQNDKRHRNDHNIHKPKIAEKFPQEFISPSSSSTSAAFSKDTPKGPSKSGTLPPKPMAKKNPVFGANNKKVDHTKSQKGSSYDNGDRYNSYNSYNRDNRDNFGNPNNNRNNNNFNDFNNNNQNHDFSRGRFNGYNNNPYPKSGGYQRSTTPSNNQNSSLPLPSSTNNVLPPLNNDNQEGNKRKPNSSIFIQSNKKRRR
ncbi:hypothetical protein BN7_3085 [Wickerhamomyces ciferrii]|uniref:Helicase n=1 Tax=Wickerhamomyces ciferrii (strain ATCC 14091 / BCRC 22168 / CBS 111 / JCM 3599 / NBRC 0793 / NRRL Y-1031 F-60-10) TaxID=1206466 RepID=K0KQJ5_WICCF|nr:uncharacterized protein BN7_3085 [Wickerhamomyces ciferrii]CCH43533.1 hypothetical protein BN7_3085 [Wickerhamomyces ciferrii]